MFLFLFTVGCDDGGSGNSDSNSTSSYSVDSSSDEDVITETNNSEGISDGSESEEAGTEDSNMAEGSDDEVEGNGFNDVVEDAELDEGFEWIGEGAENSGDENSIDSEGTSDDSDVGDEEDVGDDDALNNDANNNEVQAKEDCKFKVTSNGSSFLSFGSVDLSEEASFIDWEVLEDSIPTDKFNISIVDGKYVGTFNKDFDASEYSHKHFIITIIKYATKGEHTASYTVTIKFKFINGHDNGNHYGQNKK